MKITVNQKVLRQALESAVKAINQKPTVPILSNFLLKGDGETLQIIGSDSNITIIESFPNSAQGSVVVPVNFLELVKNLPEEVVEIETGERIITVSWKNGHSTLPSFEADDYPDITKSDGKGYSISADKFVSALNHTIPCIADDDLRPVMGGVYFKVKEKNIDVVATDSRVLSKVEIETPENEEQFDFIIPAPALSAVKSAVKGGEDIEILHDDTNCVFRVGGTTVISRRILGSFPRYEAVIPKEFNATLKAKKNDLISTLKRILVCASKSSGHIKLSLNMLNNTIEAQDLSFSTAAKESPDNILFEGQDLTIGFKGEYLIKAIQTLESVDVEIKFTDARRAAIITSDSDPCTILLMPVQV